MKKKLGCLSTESAKTAITMNFQHKGFMKLIRMISIHCKAPCIVVILVSHVEILFLLCILSMKINHAVTYLARMSWGPKYFVTSVCQSKL